MLPFLGKNKQKQVGGIIVENRKPDQAEDAPDSGLRAAAKDLIDAVHASDEAGVMSALQSAFDLMNSAEPMEEPQDEVSEGFEE